MADGVAAVAAVVAVVAAVVGVAAVEPPAVAGLVAATLVEVAWVALRYPVRPITDMALTTPVTIRARR
ncbi:MAG TPA: hypothetical protein VGI06_13160, partial [Acidimicrobiales bacterium]